MADYTIKRLEEVHDVLGDYPGEMRMMTRDLEAEQVAFTYRRMPQHTGGKGSYGHRHKEQEEVYFVASGKLQFKLNDDIVELERGTAVRVPPETWRSVWNDEPEDAELIIVSKVVPGGSRGRRRVPRELLARVARGQPRGQLSASATGTPPLLVEDGPARALRRSAAVYLAGSAGGTRSHPTCPANVIQLGVVAVDADEPRSHGRPVPVWSTGVNAVGLLDDGDEQRLDRRAGRSGCIPGAKKFACEPSPT